MQRWLWGAELFTPFKATKLDGFVVVQLLPLCANAKRCHMKNIPLPKPQGWSLMKHRPCSEVMQSLDFSSHT